MSVIAKCDSCSHVFDVDESESPLYECGNCGTRFTRENSLDGSGHQCPDCNKFASKVTDWACPDCGEGEGIETEAFKCPDCDEWKAVEDVEMSEAFKPKTKVKPLESWEMFDIQLHLEKTLEDTSLPERTRQRLTDVTEHVRRINRETF